MTSRVIRAVRRVPRPARGQRRLAIAAFRPSTDGRIYTRLELDATALLAYCERATATGTKVTVTHVVVAALGRAVAEVPEIRARVVLGRAVPLPTTAISLTVDVGGGEDLQPVRVEDAATKTPAQIAAELRPALHHTRNGGTGAHRSAAWWAAHVPWFALRPALAVAGFVMSGIGVDAFGQRAFPLGAALVSNVGPLDLDEAFLAPMPMARVPLYLSVGAIRDAALAVDGRVEVRPRLVLVATGDHRLVDGAHAGRVIGRLRELLLDPDRLGRTH